MSNEELNDIVSRITAANKEELKRVVNCTKEVLTSTEAAQYMGISMSTLYKLTSKELIPYYKPMGKVCFFKRTELEAWLLQNRCSTASEIAARAASYTMKGGAR